MSGKLYFVATPIGNLMDTSFRQIDTLKSVDVILCEDTRSSLKFLQKYEIKKSLESFHKFNYKKVSGNIIDRLLNGTNFALITDAGTPCISDPGSELISLLNENKIEYTIIPGACAFVNAFALSGFKMPCTFLGFLPNTKKEIDVMLENVKNVNSTLIFYCSPHSLKEDLKTLYKYFGDKKCCSVRELTKIYEEIEYFNLFEGYSKEPKGEYVLLIENFNDKQNELNDLSVLEHYNYYIQLNYEKNDAIKQVAKDRKVAKNIIYNEIVNILK